ncbi:MAG: TonB-dependent receptor, partial [Bacteroidales bacterium]|nr:TonB-dependent receptor [Bacteroidales bacterium]
MKKVFVLIFVLVTTLVSAQTGSVRGFVYDKETGEPMMLTNVMLENTQIGTTTDVNGYFVLSKIKTGNYSIKVTSLGYETYTAPIKVEKNKVLALKIDLAPSATELQTIEIQGRQEVARTESQVSIEKITSKDIQQMPSIGGQADLAQYIQVVPGVVFSGDQGGQLYIRGGSAIHNKVLLDGMVVYNPFHS